MNTDLVRFVDSISRDKNIEKESIFLDIEAAINSAVRKAVHEDADIDVTVDRVSGEISVVVDDEQMDMRSLGRIPAQTAKQVLIQKVREDERNSIFEEFSTKVGTVVSGTVARYEGGALIIGIGRSEGIMPRGEQIPGESHQPGERIRGMILDVREERSQVRIVLTQTHPDYIRRLFELEVPEVGERIIEIRALAREPGYRTKVAVTSIDAKVDAVGACVGVRGSRIKNIVEELGGEKIDIVRWNESSQILISNALKPAEVQETFLCFELGRATVIVNEDQLSLAIGKRGQNVRLAARLTGWDIDILTPVEYNKSLDQMEQALKTVEGVEDILLDKMLAIGVISLHDIVDVGGEALVDALDIPLELANQVVTAADDAARRIAEETEAAKLLAADAEANVESLANEALSEVSLGGDESAGVATATTEQEAGGAADTAQPIGADAAIGEVVVDEGETETAEPETAATDQPAAQPEGEASDPGGDGGDVDGKGGLEGSLEAVSAAECDEPAGASQDDEPPTASVEAPDETKQE